MGYKKSTVDPILGGQVPVVPPPPWICTVSRILNSQMENLSFGDFYKQKKNLSLVNL